MKTTKSKKAPRAPSITPRASNTDTTKEEVMSKVKRNPDLRFQQLIADTCGRLHWGLTTSGKLVLFHQTDTQNEEGVSVIELTCKVVRGDGKQR